MAESVYCVICHEAVLERIHELEPGKSLIGRCDDSQIWLADPHVSREHAIISWNVDRLTVQDLGSRNGTQINGRSIRGEEPLTDGDEVRLGPYIVRVFYEIGDAIRCFVNSEISTCADIIRTSNLELRSLKFPDLTPAQRRVYEGFAEGLSEKEVAARLKISVHTVHTHAKAIYKTFAISSRAELVRRWAAQQSVNNRHS